QWNCRSWARRWKWLPTPNTPSCFSTSSKGTHRPVPTERGEGNESFAPLMARKGVMREVETPSLWTPEGVKQGQTSFVGRNVETGGSIVVHTFHFHDKVTGRSCTVKVPAESGVDYARVEDSAAEAFERWLLEARAK